MQKRVLTSHDELINFMIELKANQVEDIDIWNKSQAYHGKKLALLYCKVQYIQVTFTISLYSSKK